MYGHIDVSISGYATPADEKTWRAADLRSLVGRT